MIRRQGLLAALLVLAGAARAPAEEAPEPDPKISLGLRLGYAVRAGQASEYTIYPPGQLFVGERPGENTTRQIPIWLDAGYLVTRNVFIGLYAQYGFALINDCNDGANCSATDLRFGLQGQYHFLPGRPVDPWLGLGAGYEWLSDSRTGGGSTITDSIQGIELFNLQGGADFKAAGAFTLGPFASVSFGQYSSATLSGDGIGETNLSLKDKTSHEWILFGVKGSFGLRASAPRPEIDEEN